MGGGMMDNTPKDIVIIGGGIIGIASAALLSEKGHKVTLIDRTGITEETSSGNAGAFAFTDVLPIASKGIMRKLPKWLLDPLGPFTIRPSYLPSLIPWLYQFWRASSKSKQVHTIEAQVAMMGLAEKEMLALIKRASLENYLGTMGNLEVYESENELQSALPSWKQREKYGIEVRHMKADEMAQLQPGLSPRFVAGSFVEAWRNVTDPKLFGKALWQYAQNLGAKFIKATILEITPLENGAKIITDKGEKLTPNFTIIASGAWSKHFAQKLGDAIPLDTERGYNTTLPTKALDLRQQVTFGGHGFVIVPLATGIRVGGAVEMGGLKLPANFKRCDAMLTKAKTFFPDLKIDGGKQWMGHRPSIPDGLPVIGTAKASPYILYAFGHGHLGLTQSAATARLINDIIEKNSSEISIAPFDPRRF
ncbi:NAD(P)/FAD-dependent oxidoreductase [Bartonella sp. HY761]|uniref:NAD(P)/FAD-dependent oxidoreductase n=1 Tax=Bartonella sp. HY761 TaxID=2979330 RepID=UPI002DDD88E6|nr:FAD-dependent oxidoreductase [Bartonella sp. HY761]